MDASRFIDEPAPRAWVSLGSCSTLLRLDELLACVAAWTEAASRPLNPAQRFCIVVSLAQALPKVVSILAAVDRRALLVDIVTRGVDCGNATVLVDAL